MKKKNIEKKFKKWRKINKEKLKKKKKQTRRIKNQNNKWENNWIIVNFLFFKVKQLSIGLLLFFLSLKLFFIFFFMCKT